MRPGFRSRPALVVGVVVVTVVVSASAGALRSNDASVLERSAGAAGRATPGGAATNMTKPHAIARHNRAAKPHVLTHPRTFHLTKARSAVFDVRKLRSVVVKRERPERRAPGEIERAGAKDADSLAGLPTKVSRRTIAAAASAPAPGPDSSFEGLDFANWGQGHPPDENGDVGPTYYIDTINVSIGIYDKSTHARVAAFTFNSFMSQGNFGNLCDTNNFGDPVVLYDSYEDRWVITDFAFVLDGSGNVNPPHAFECFAVSKTGDPVSGGWNFYSIEAPGGLGDYPKFGIWPDGIYMSANMFGYAANGGFIGFHMWALNKQQMYAGAPSPQVVDFAGDTSDFTVIPANSRLQAGTPPAGSPEYFVSTEQFLNAQSIYKFHVDWDKISTSTFTGPLLAQAPTCWPNAAPANASTPANAADTLSIRAMAQAQYSNIGGAESLWIDHTVNRGEFPAATCGTANSNNATLRWYQVNVTGGTVAANDVQAATYDPEAANTFFRFMPALAVDRAGDLAVTYTKSNATTNPQVKYAGRLPGDPLNTLGQSEQTLIDGTGAQSGNCGGSACTRWGDYAGMALDPNGCEFWMTGEYYATNGLNDLTRIGSFHYPSCTPVGNGTLTGTVTNGVSPISGVTVSLGNRTTTTNGSGNYSFTVPAGTYPSESAAKAGFTTASATTLVVPDDGTLTQDFTLNAAPQSGCITDNSQNAFQRGVPSATCDLTSSPGSVQLSNAPSVDQQNTAGTNTGTGTTTNTSWAGQTFTAGVSGQLTKVDFQMFCANGCTSNPDLVVSIRATSGGSPTGADLVSATIPGDNSGNTATFVASFATPLSVTSGTQYALIVRTASSPGTGGYFWIRSSPSTYAGGLRVTSTNSGATWTQDSTRDGNFHTYVSSGFKPSATFVSSLKDANPDATHTAHWTTLSWTAATPAGSNVKFQVAGSNSQYGPFNFVGPDGTAATFFTTSGASLSQFNGSRYLKYEAFLATTNSSVTPSLSMVEVCFLNAATTGVTVDPASGTFGGTTDLSAVLNDAGVGVAGATIHFALNGTDVGSTTTGANGVAVLNGISLTGIGVGTYPSGVSASFAGGGGHGPSSDSNSLTITKANQAITVTTHAPAAAAVGASFGVAATAPAGAVTFSSSGACTNAGATFTMTSGSANCSVKYDQAGNSNYNAAPQVVESVTAQKASQTITVTTHAPATAVNGSSFSVAATAPGGTVTFSSAGACTNAGAAFTMTAGTGTCSVKYDQAGNANYHAAPQVVETVTATTQRFTLTVSKSGTGTGTVTSSPAGISCGATCSADFDKGTTVTLSAAAGSGSSFAGWSGACSGTASCSVTVDAAKSVTATFKKKPPPKCVVPNVKGKPLATARKKISAAHCKVGKLTQARSKTVKKGNVVSQSPRPTTKLASGGKVNLVVSKGKR